MPEAKLRQYQDRISSSTGSNLESNLFADENDLRGFFDKAGFRIEEYQYSNVIQDLSSVRHLNLNQEDMKRAFELLALSKTLILALRNTRLSEPSVTFCELSGATENLPTTPETTLWSFDFIHGCPGLIQQFFLEFWFALIGVNDNFLYCSVWCGKLRFSSFNSAITLEAVGLQSPSSRFSKKTEGRPRTNYSFLSD